MEDYQALASKFNVGATQNIGRGAVGGFLPGALAQDKGRNAMQDLIMARLMAQRGVKDAGYDLQNRSLDFQLKSQEPNVLDIAGLGLAGYGAYKGFQARQAAQMPKDLYDSSWALQQPRYVPGGIR
jgi:hypothetical protein